MRSHDLEKYIEKLTQSLPPTFVYRGEFGIELSTFLPFVFTLHVLGLMENYQVSTYAGMRPYYFFLKDNQFIERSNENRCYVPSQDRWWPNNDLRRAPLPFEEYPDYATSLLKSTNLSHDKKPVIFIQNKFCMEWGIGPINYLPISTLRALFEVTTAHFDIVYSREGITSNKQDYALDDNSTLQYPDLLLCNEFPHVTVLESVNEMENYNLHRLEIIAHSSAFITVQGGASCTFAYFDKPTFVYHRHGVEAEHAYWRGIYRNATLRTTPLYVSDNSMAAVLFLNSLDPANLSPRVKRINHLKLKRKTYAFRIRSKTYMRNELGHKYPK